MRQSDVCDRTLEREMKIHTANFSLKSNIVSDLGHDIRSESLWYNRYYCSITVVKVVVVGRESVRVLVGA